MVASNAAPAVRNKPDTSMVLPRPGAGKPAGRHAMVTSLGWKTQEHFTGQSIIHLSSGE